MQHTTRPNVVVRLVAAALVATTSALAQQQPAAPAVEARIHDVHNRVELSAEAAGGAASAPSAPRPVRVNEVLAPGTHLATQRDAEATVRYADVGELQVEEDTRLVMFGPPGRLPVGAPPIHDTSLVRGAIRVLVNAPAANRTASIAIHTPGGTVYMNRGECRVHVDASHSTRVAVYRGRARVAAGPRGFLIGAGTATRIESATPGVPMFPPVPLPRAPTWTQPFPERVLATGGSASVEARYAPPRAARHPPRGWVQELARDANFDDVVFERAVAANELRFAAERLPEGAYFARVVSVDAEHFESLASETQRFQVAGPRVIPGAPGRRAEVLVPQGFFCRLDGEVAVDPGVPVALTPARNHELQCSTTRDMRDPTRLPIPAEQAGELAHTVRLDGAWTPAGGTAPVAIRLADASGRAYAYANVTVRANPGVTVDPVREEAERGLYTTDVRWGPNTPLVLEFIVNDAVRFTERLGGPGAPSPAR